VQQLDLLGFYAVLPKDKARGVFAAGKAISQKRTCFAGCSGYDSRTMKLETTQTVPLTMLENGAIRITGTRVSLDSIIYGYKRGESAEELHDSFPAVKLEQVYAVI
jgi:hypothetical protein